MDIVKKLIHDLRLRQANADSKAPPVPTTVREVSNNEKNAVYQPPNYGMLFCCHSKSYFDVCQACRRDKKQALLQYQAFCKRYL
jgi:hypothetical protein